MASDLDIIFLSVTRESVNHTAGAFHSSLPPGQMPLAPLVLRVQAALPAARRALRLRHIWQRTSGCFHQAERGLV